MLVDTQMYSMVADFDSLVVDSVSQSIEAYLEYIDFLASEVVILDEADRHILHQVNCQIFSYVTYSCSHQFLLDGLQHFSWSFYEVPKESMIKRIRERKFVKYWKLEGVDFHQNRYDVYQTGLISAHSILFVFSRILRRIHEPCDQLLLGYSDSRKNLAYDFSMIL